MTENRTRTPSPGDLATTHFSHTHTPPGAPSPATTPRVLLVWDAPNLDMGLGTLLGGRPTAAFRPRFDALGRWLLSYTEQVTSAAAEETDADDLDEAAEGTFPEHSGELEAEATVFTNISPSSAEIVRPWVEALRNVGFAVFAKPKVDESSDVDEDMLDHIARRHNAGMLAGVVVASADGQAFREPLEQLAEQGIPTLVIGFREHITWVTSDSPIDFLDLEDIPGVFRERLPRVQLENLPEDGAWLQPLRPLSALLGHH